MTLSTTIPAAKPLNIAILFEDFGPYHAARMEALAGALGRQQSRLFAFRFSELSTIYGWKPSTPAGVEVITLGVKRPEGIAASFKVALAFGRELRKRNIKAVFLPSYSPLPNMLCFFSAKLQGCKTILMNETWHGTEKAGRLGRWVKHILIRLYDAGLVGGTLQMEYACNYGLKPSKVFLGYDVVEVKYYTEEAKRWKHLGAGSLPVPGLPFRYFLNLGRFVPKKNLPVLISAYALLCQRFPSTAIALVLVGEGPEEQHLRQLANKLQLPVRNGLDATSKPANGPELVFYPFQQVDKTPLFFSRCEAFILPSRYEEWGLVVNEAMACGAAVLVSKNVGCVPDLLVEGKNGFSFDPDNAENLSSLLQKFVQDPGLAGRLGASGLKHIGKWGPERFADGGIRALQASYQ